MQGLNLCLAVPTDDKGGDCRSAGTGSKPGVCRFVVPPTLGAPHLTRAPGPPLIQLLSPFHVVDRLFHVTHYLSVHNATHSAA